MNASNLSDQLYSNIKNSLKGKSLGIMLFGSVARGTAGPNSDIDVLQLSEKKHWPYSNGKVNVSVYTEDFLKQLATEGSLFVLHLLKDGVVIEDSQKLIFQCLECYNAPSNYDKFFERLRSAVPLLDIEKKEYISNWHSFNRLSLYFLRSTLFIKCAASGAPKFCLNEIAKSLNDRRLVKAYSIKHVTSPNWSLFALICELIREYLACSIENRYSSIAELVNANHDNDLLVSLGLRLMRRYEPIDSYAEFKNHILNKSKTEIKHAK